MKPCLSLAKNILASNLGRLKFPYKLTFVTTYNCNYKCKTCNIWERKPKNELSLEEITSFFQKSCHFNWIDFTGGEPWLRKDFPDMVKAAIAHCPNLLLIHFPTNGYMTKQIVNGVKKIMEERPKKLIITVSTDGNEAVNDNVRGIKGGWKRQIETYKQLHKIPGVDVVLGMTLSSYNADQYNVAFAAAKVECPWLKPVDFHINVVHLSEHYYGNKASTDIREGKEKIIEQVNAYQIARGMPRGIVSLLERQYLKQVDKYLHSELTPMRCHALKSSCFIDSWGNVYPCSMYNARIASLRDHDYDLRAIWKLPRTLELQREIWNYKCPQCWTPCEAYQTILGNFMGLRQNTPMQEKEYRSLGGNELESK